MLILLVPCPRSPAIVGLFWFYGGEERKGGSVAGVGYGSRYVRMIMIDDMKTIRFTGSVLNGFSGLKTPHPECRTRHLLKRDGDLGERCESEASYVGAGA